MPDVRSETRLQGWWRSIDSLRLRTALVVLFGISLVHFGSLFTYHQSLEQELDLANEVRLADQLLTIKRSVMRAPVEERENVAHDFSGGSIDAHWGSTPYAVEGDTAGQNWEPLRRNLRALAPEIAEDGLIIGPDNQAGDDPHLAVVSIKLPDASWINVNLVSWDRKVPPPGGMLVSTTLMALGAVVVSMLLVRWFTRPLTAVATAAKDFYRGKTVDLIIGFATGGSNDAYARALAHRQPRYAAMARWGVTVTAEEVAEVRSPTAFDALIAHALDRRASTT